MISVQKVVTNCSVTCFLNSILLMKNFWSCCYRNSVFVRISFFYDLSVVEDVYVVLAVDSNVIFGRFFVNSVRSVNETSSRFVMSNWNVSCLIVRSYNSCFEVCSSNIFNGVVLLSFEISSRRSFTSIAVLSLWSSNRNSTSVLFVFLRLSTSVLFVF